MRYLNRVHLNGLRAVEAVARLGSLAEAAAELGVTPGAVSQQVIRTEQGLGRALFARHGSRLVLLDFGREVSDRLRIGFQHLTAAIALADEERRHLLTVSVAPVFAAKWLVPRLDGFVRRHPDLRLRIEASVGFADLDGGDVDAAIRVGPGGWPGVSQSRIIGQTIFPVCAPALAATITTSADLARATIIRDANDVRLWDIWRRGAGAGDLVLPAGPVFSDASLCLDAAIGGLGVMLAWPTLATDALAQNRLVMPLAAKVRTGNSYWLVTSPTRRASPKVEAFRAWLVAEVKASLERVPGLAEGSCD